MTSLKDILLAQKPARKSVIIDGWPVPVLVEEFNVGRRIAFHEILDENIRAVRRHKDEPTKYPYVEPIDESIVGFIFSVVEEDGSLVFSLDDIQKIKEMPYPAIQKIYLEAMQLANRHNLFADIEAEKKS